MLSRRFSSSSVPSGQIKTAGPYGFIVYLRYWAQYANMIRTIAADDALYLSVILAFRPGHPPLRIPWNEITAATVRRLWRNYIVLYLGREERVPMRIPARMARKLGVFERFPAVAAAESSTF
jgi:hypothetical protein